MKIIGKKSASSILSSALLIVFVLACIFLCVSAFFFLAMSKNIFSFAPHLSLQFGSLAFRFQENIKPGIPLQLSILVFAVFLLYTIYQLRMIFKSFAKEEVFSFKNANRIRRIGLSVIVMSFALSVYNYFAAEIISETLNITSNNLSLSVLFRLEPTMIFCGILIIIFGEIFKIATKIAEENKLTI